MNKTVIISIAFFLISYFSYAQNIIKLGTELRPKLLIDNGYKKPHENVFLYISQRSRLFATFLINKTETHISFQDVRIWGDDDNYKASGAFGNTASVSIHQAWSKYFFNKHTSIKVGRQAFSYDDERILSARNWNDYQVTYDALLFVFQDSLNRVDIAASWNNQKSASSYYSDELFKTINFIRYERIVGGFNFSLLDVISGNTVTDTTEDIYVRNTTGLNVEYKDNINSARIVAYYQTNLNNESADVSAFCLSVAAKRYLIKNKLALELGYDLLSGNDATSSDSSYLLTQHRFDILYGKRHGYYGYMDYYNTIPDQGLQDYMLKVEFSPFKNIKLNSDYHFFALANNCYATSGSIPNQELNKNLGHEIDFTCNWKISQEIQLKCGYSFYLNSSSTEQVLNTSFESIPQFGYLVLTIKPDFTIPITDRVKN